MNPATPASNSPVKSMPPAVAPEPWKVHAFGGGGLLVMTVIAWYFGAQPLLSRHDLSLKQQADLIAAKNQYAETQRTLASLQEQIDDVRSALTRQPLNLLPASALNARLAMVTDLAVKGGAALDDLQPGRSMTGAKYDTMPIHLAGTGSFNSFTGVLHRMRQEFPDLAVTSFELSGSSADPQSTPRFNVDLLWYTQAARTPLVPDDAKARRQ